MAEIHPPGIGDPVILPPPAVGGGALAALGQIAGLFQPVDGAVGEHDGQGAAAFFADCVGQFADIAVLDGQQMQYQHLSQRFFQIFFQR